MESIASQGFGSGAILQRAESALTFDTLLLAVVDPNRPRPEEFLVVHGAAAASLITWCDGGHPDDPLWQRVLRDGVAVTDRTTDSGSELARMLGHGLVQVLPASLDQQRVWMLALGRSDQPFAAAEQRQAGLLLRMHQIDFDRCDEPGLGRLLLAPDDTLLHADPASEARFTAEPALLADFAHMLRQVAAQRWPIDQERRNRWHHAVLNLPPSEAQAADAASPVWVRFCESVGARGLPPHLEIEIRPVTTDDAPAVGVVEDLRVALALGYLSDHFAESPSLADVSARVHTSTFHFHRLFTRSVGMSPKQYLMRMQFQVAKWMLRTTRLPISEIARQSGFASHGHFTATFHRFVGMSPTAYRDQT